MQTKLGVDLPGDRFEREADRVADRVMRMPEPQLQRACACGGDCAACRAEQPHQRENELQRRRAPGMGSVGSDFQHPRSGGRPLPIAERQFFEPRFGRDFGDVRLHTGPEAAAAARSVNALAYTIASDVVFGEGQYRPATEAGRELLAHELAHTLQQTGPGAGEIWRKIGDGHDLTSPRFAGDLVLEAVYDDGERQLKSGDRGAAVSKLQSALIDAGFSRSGLRANGNFGADTTAAVLDFQRASGLGGSVVRGLDGIVDAVTMGWLDQRFSKEPTPPGKGPGGTPGCAAIKTVSVDLISLDGSAGSMFQDLDRASSIFNQCCVRFTVTGGGSESPARTKELLGGDNVLHRSIQAFPSAEEIRMFAGAAADFKLSGRIRVFYVASVIPDAEGRLLGYAIPAVGATGARAPLRNMVVVTSQAPPTTLAHEIGHILLNQGAVKDHQDMDPEYLMSAEAGPTPGERITPEQCRIISANA